jgi:hypothetical protein
MNTPAALNQKEFAKLNGWDKSYVTRLKQAGRIVLNESGMVDVAASMARLRATESNLKPAVSDHFQHRRESRDATGNASSARQTAPGEENDDGPGISINSHNAGRMKLVYEALAKQREHAEACGQLVRADAVGAALANAVTIFRSRMDAMPDLLTAAVMVERDEARVRAVLTDFKDQALHELQDAFSSVGKRIGHV